MKYDHRGMVYMAKVKDKYDPWRYIYFEDHPDNYPHEYIQERVFQAQVLKIHLLRKEYVVRIARQYPETFDFFISDVLTP
jgi:hypothetical protein